MRRYINLWDDKMRRFDHNVMEKDVVLSGKYVISRDNIVIAEGEYNNGTFIPPRIIGDCIVYWRDNPQIIIYQYSMMTGKFMQIIADNCEFCHDEYEKTARLISIRMIEGKYYRDKLCDSYRIYNYDPYANIRELSGQYNYKNGELNGLQYEYDSGRLHVRYNIANNKISDMKYY